MTKCYESGSNEAFCLGEGPLQCTSCPPHYMLDGGLCMECQRSQFYDPPTQLCKQCHESCYMCSGPGQFSCLACLVPLHLDRQNNQCVPCCTQADQQNCCHCDKETGQQSEMVSALISRSSWDLTNFFHSPHFRWMYEFEPSRKAKNRCIRRTWGLFVSSDGIGKFILAQFSYHSCSDLLRSNCTPLWCYFHDTTSEV